MKNIISLIIVAIGLLKIYSQIIDFIIIYNNESYLIFYKFGFLIGVISPYILIYLLIFKTEYFQRKFINRKII